MEIKWLALFWGIIWSSIVFCIGIIATVRKTKYSFIEMSARIYFGYAPTIKGSICGAFWGFLDGWMSSYIILWIIAYFLQR